jgi:hypothetical protein
MYHELEKQEMYKNLVGKSQGKRDVGVNWKVKLKLILVKGSVKI